MTPKHLYIGIALLAVVLVGNSYLSHMLANTRAEQKSQDVEASVKQLRLDLTQQLLLIAKDKQEVKTPAQIAVTVPKYTPDVKPLVIVTNPIPTGSQDVAGQIPSVSLPDAPSAIVGGLVIPKEQVPAYWKSVTTCAENTAKLGACEKQVPLVEAERDAWKKAAKGSFWSRTKTAIKWTAIGIGVGAGIAYATH